MGDTWLALQRLRQHRLNAAREVLRGRVQRVVESGRRAQAVREAVQAEEASARVVTQSEAARSGESVRAIDLQSLAAFKAGAAARLEGLQQRRSAAESELVTVRTEERRARDGVGIAHVEHRALVRYNETRSAQRLAKLEGEREEEMLELYLARRG